MTRILIIGIGNPVPSFIHRRLNALIGAGIKVTAVAEHDQRFELKGASIIPLGGQQNLLSKLRSIIYVLANPAIFFRMLSARTELSFAQRLRWAVKYFPLARIANPDVIHIQWLSAVPEFQWLRSFFTCPIMASARGSQVTVYPITRLGYKAIIEKAIQSVDYIHCVSHDIAMVCRKLGAADEKLVVNYNGIDLQHFYPLTAQKIHTHFTIISVGALMWRKGYLYQLQLLERLRDAGRDVHLLWIGDGPDREALQYQAAKLGVANRITFVGKVKSDELPAWLAKADVFVSTSFAEGLANSVVEAAACGLPVVTFACEGMEEVLKPGVNGFILPFGDVVGLADRMQYLMDHPEERNKMAVAARHTIENKFDEHQWVLSMVKTYESLERK